MIVPSCVWRPQEKYRFLLTSDFEIALNSSYTKNFVFFANGIRLAKVENNILTVFANFSWDGCSPSKVFGLSWISTPSPAETITASLCHDLFYQFLFVKGCPWTRAWADKEFKRILDINGFHDAKVYYAAVRLFGGAFARRKKEDSEEATIVES